MVIQGNMVGSEEWLFREEIAYNDLSACVMAVREFVIERGGLRMENLQLSSAGVFVLYSQTECERPVTLQLNIQGEAVVSRFVFSKSSMHDKGGHNLHYLPRERSLLSFKAGVQCVCLHVVLSPDYYFKLIGRDSSLHATFVQQFSKGRPVRLVSNDLIITPAILKVIQSLVHSPKTGELRLLHTDARIIDLLSLQLEQLHSRKRLLRRLTAADITQLEKAAALLRDRFAEPPSQVELARLVGMNPAKLRRDFKAHFGVTVYEYVVRLRMEAARKLLVEQRKSILETAELTGFQYQNNFSHAFKKYFGVSPKEIRF